MGNRVAHRRHELDLTQSQLALLVGVSRQSISSIESESESPRLQVAQRLASALGTSLDYLFGDFESSPVASGVYLGYLNGNVLSREPSPMIATSHFPNGLMTNGVSTLIDRPFVFVDGCDPILAFLTRMMSEESHFRYLWTSKNNQEALESVVSETCHVGLVHFEDHSSTRNLPKGLTAIALADWNLVLATKKSSAFSNIDLGSLGDEAIRFALRKSGSGVRSFYDSVTGGTSLAVEVFESHQDVANAVRFGTYDATLTMEGIAVSSNLSYKIVHSQRSFLIAKDSILDLPEVKHFIEVVTDRKFKRKIDLLSGYFSV